MTDAEGTGRPGRVVAALFPGSAQVWLTAAVVFGLGTIALFGWLGLRTHEVKLGSNSVAPRYYVASALQAKPLCVQRARIPAGTGRVRFSIDTRTIPRPAVDVVVRQTNGTVIRGRAPPGPAGFHDVDALLAQPVTPAAGRADAIASICLRPTENVELFVWGQNQLGITDKPLKAGRKEVANRVSLAFLPTAPFAVSATAPATAFTASPPVPGALAAALVTEPRTDLAMFSASFKAPPPW